MNLTQYSNYLPVLFAARVTPLVWGIHGVAKTTKPAQWAAANGHKLFNLRLGNMADQGDIIGLLDIRRDVKGKALSSDFIMPKWLKELVDFANANPDKYAIIHLDEVNRVRKDMLNIVFQIALENRIHEYELPDNVRVIASANPPIAGYWVNDFTENALLDRFCHLMLTPETGEWLDYAREKAFNTDVINFIAATPASLHHVQTNWSPDEYCKPSNRAWEAVARLHALGASHELIYGCVGSAQGAAFYTFQESNKLAPVSGEDVLLKGYNKATRKRTLALVDAGRMAELWDTINQIAKLAEGEPKDESEEFTVAQGAAVARFLTDIPTDVAFNAIGTLGVLNRLNTAISPVDLDDKRAGIEDQWAFYRKMAEAKKADPKLGAKTDGDAETKQAV